MDNNATQVTDNGVAQTDMGSTQATTTTTSAGEGTSTFSWKNNLSTDLKNSPLMSKFEDGAEGFNKMVESHANLEKLLGNEKVPIPKGDNDTEGWSRFAKAMGIPSKASEYGLPDASLPKEIDPGISKEKFAEIMHAHKQTPAQAKALWKTFNDINAENYNKQMAEVQKNLTESINRLKGEWGDAYSSNVELGQMVINKFTDDQDMNDYITATLSQDPRGIKFLAKIGGQFAENKVGEFSMKRFTLAPEQAREEWQKIVRDPSHAYNNDKATPRERQAAIDYVNSLIRSATQGQA